MKRLRRELALLVHGARLRQLAARAGYHSRPAFLIIGAQKAGTTALHSYLTEHPRIMPAREKEIGFFVPELFADWREHPSHRVLCTANGTAFDDRRTLRRATAWYHAQFPLPHELGRLRRTFEATPEYLYYPRAAERIFEYDPELKLIVLLRDPVERAFSAWNMYRSFGDYRPLIYAPKKENREFDQAVREEIDQISSGAAASGPAYVARGLYHEQLLRYFERFHRHQVLVIDSEELRRSTSTVLDDVVDFLDLPAYERHGAWEPLFSGRYDPRMPDQSVGLLRDFYRPYNEALYRLLDRDFRWD